MRIYLIIALTLLAYYGFNGLQGDRELRSITLNELETEGIGDSRYLEITDCFTTGSFVYEYNQDKPENPNKVIFAVINQEAYSREVLRSLIFGDSTMADPAVMEGSTGVEDSLSSGLNFSAKPTTHLLVQRNPTRYAEDCAAGDGSCLQDLTEKILSGEELQSLTLKGTTRIGLDDISEEDRNLIQTLNLNIAEDVIFLEEDAEPQDTTTALLMLIGGIMGIGAILWSYRRKA